LPVMHRFARRGMRARDTCLRKPARTGLEGRAEADAVEEWE
jgi:hypothetical protein